MTEDVSTLPKWAQRKIATLEYELRQATDLVERRGGQPGQNVFLRGSGRNLDALEPLGGLYTAILFRTEDGDEIECSYAASAGSIKPSVLVRAVNGSLVITPEAANVVRVGSK